MSQSDRKLVAAVARGDRRALESLYREVKDDVLSTVYHLVGDRSVAEDVLHDVFIAFARKAAGLKITVRLRGYLLVSAVNRARDLLRRRRIEPVAVETLDERCSRRRGPPDEAARLEDAARVAAALAELPAEQREVVVLRVYGRMKFREIAEHLGIPENTAQSRHRYALRVRVLRR